MGNLFEEGNAIRSEVLGKDIVDRSIKEMTEFNEPMLRLATEYCWGAVWGRDTLSRKQRSMLNLAMLSALNRQNEFKLHLRGAIRNGVTRDEIREVLLQVAVYCGIPAGVEAFRIAKEVLSEEGVL